MSNLAKIKECSVSEPMRTLCVDYNSEALTVLSKYLESEGHHVVAVTSIDEAKKALDTEDPFHYCICEYQMPEMDGDDFLWHAATVNSKTIRVLTAGFAGMNWHVKSNIDKLCSIFIEKPFLLPELSLKLSTYRHPVESHAAVHEAVC